jgi:hypothetical protein
LHVRLPSPQPPHPSAYHTVDGGSEEQASELFSIERPRHDCFGVIHVDPTMSMIGPLYSELQTLASAAGMSQKCQNRTHASQQNDLGPHASFDHLVGAREQHRSDGDAQRLRSGQIDDEIKPSRLLDREVGSSK